MHFSQSKMHVYLISKLNAHKTAKFLKWIRVTRWLAKWGCRRRKRPARPSTSKSRPRSRGRSPRWTLQRPLTPEKVKNESVRPCVNIGEEFGFILIIQIFCNGPTPASFCSFSFFSTTILQKNGWLQQDLNSDRRSRRRARQPIDHQNYDPIDII